MRYDPRARMIPRETVLALAIALFVPTIAAGQEQPAPGTEAVIAMLSGFEHAPSIQEWRAFGPQLVPVLSRIASDPQQPGFVRLRALQAASAFSTPAARAMLRRAIASEDPLFAREGALALARAFGARAIRDVAVLLSHDDVAVREGVIAALASIDDPRARERLRAHLAREIDPVLRRRIEAVLAGASATGSGGDGAARDG